MSRFPQLMSQREIDRQERNRRYRELLEDTLGCAALWLIFAIGFFFAGVL